MKIKFIDSLEWIFLFVLLLFIAWMLDSDTANIQTYLCRQTQCGSVKRRERLNLLERRWRRIRKIVQNILTVTTDNWNETSRIGMRGQLLNTEISQYFLRFCVQQQFKRHCVWVLVCYSPMNVWNSSRQPFRTRSNMRFSKSLNCGQQQMQKSNKKLIE